MIREYRTIWELTGSLLVVKDVEGVTCGELAEILLSSGEIRMGKVLKTARYETVVQVFGSAAGISPAGSKIRFLGHGQELAVSADILGRVFNGMGQPIDGGPEILAEHYLDINGAPINPVARERLSETIQTGVPAIDEQGPLMRGQTLAIFAGTGLSRASLAAQIVRQMQSEGDFAVVFAGIGIPFEESECFIQELKRMGAANQAVCFIGPEDAPVSEQIAVPRMALTAAEYLAFEKGVHVLVILTDMANYTEALGEVSAADLRTDLAALYERAGGRKRRVGSITIVSTLTVPEDDTAHPTCEITKSLTDGQIVLSGEPEEDTR